MSEKKMKAHKINSCTLQQHAVSFVGEQHQYWKGNKNVSRLQQRYTQNGANAHVISLLETHVLFAVF